jgi:2-polyprenyl-3-methyl-5-hydroxy-6-metoxy-1,4-benzoquinol methylase
MTDRDALLSRAADLDWYHGIDFGDCQTPNRAPHAPQNATLFGVMDMLQHVDLTGLSCLDIGTADGLVAFNMAMRGAGRVVATDFSPVGRPTFHTARELLNLDVEMLGGTTFDNIFDKVDEHSFDVVVCSGVLYHMLNPFDCVLKARRLLKRNGLLILQTRHHSKDTEPTLDFNLVSGRINMLGFFFTPSRTAVTGMLALGGFQLHAVRTGTKHEFIATISTNVDVQEITDAPELILRQHEKGIPYPEFRRELPGEPSAAVYRGPQDDVVIDDVNYKPDFPPHPTNPKSIIGSSYESPNKVG